MSKTAASTGITDTLTQKAAPAESPFRRFVRNFQRQKIGVAALLIVLLLFVISLIGPQLVSYDPAAPDYNAVLEAPSLKHWAGTDEFGRDIFSRIVSGTRISLSVGLLSVLFGASIGTFFWSYRRVLRRQIRLHGYARLRRAVCFSGDSAGHRHYCDFGTGTCQCCRGRSYFHRSDLYPHCSGQYAVSQKHDVYRSGAGDWC